MRALVIAAMVLVGAEAIWSLGVEAQEKDLVLVNAVKEFREERVRVENVRSSKGLLSTNVVSAALTRRLEELADQIARLTQSALYGAAEDLKGIYDFDNRKNYDHPRVSVEERRAADATAILVKKRDLAPSGTGNTYDLPGGNVLDATRGCGLCNPTQATALDRPREAFYDESNPGFCSGFRVGSSRIATAGHCIRTQADCEDTAFVFGFYRTAAQAKPEKGIPPGNVYNCKRVVGGNENRDGADWRVVEVDRVITQGSNVVLRTAATEPKLKVNDEVTVVGYPMGLPVKIANQGAVRGFANGFFVTNLDTYGGNSGSAVFNSASLAKGLLLVEGILVRGEKDFEIIDPCYISKRCTARGCRGEDVTFATEISP
jgi:hypothetical protein